MDRILGIDFGTKRIGLAISDESSQFAFPNGVLEHDKKVLKVIQEICVRDHVGTVLMGVPIGFSGQETDMTAKARDFGKRLEELGIAVVYVNEVLSTKEAYRGPTAKESIDAAAAAVVLQSFLDRKGV